MLIVELAFALLLGLIFTGIMGLIIGTAALGGFLWFFAVVFLGAWAIGTWATPVGPVFMGIAWVPFLLGAVAIALLVGAFPRPRAPVTAAEAAEAEAEASLGGFFWAFVAVMLLVIGIGVAA